MANFNKSLEEAVCIDEEVFFGPITDKEKKIRHYFQNPNINCKSSIESSHMAENDISRNDSLYKSFSVEESKYDSFEDSLNEEIDFEKPQRAKHVTLRKSFDKLKSKKYAFYDSLEDVCSLVSNIDKCSISCDVENGSNFIEKLPIVDDSLQIPHVVVTNKNQGISEQIHFDEDSLAIAELENTFDDSIEEMNMISSIEIEEINDLEDIEEENLNISNNADQKLDFVSRNLFETSVEIICEEKNIKAELDQPFNSKSKLFDSLSNSDCKDILKDSLEESEKSIGKLNLYKSIEQNSPMEELNIVETKEQNELDASVQIVYAKLGNSSDGEYISCSECCDLSKDSLEKSKNVDNSSLGEQNSHREEFNNVEPKVKSKLDASVQIIFEKMGSSSDGEYISYSECYDLSKDSLEKSKNVDSLSLVETAANNMDLKEPDVSKFAMSAPEKIEHLEKDVLDSSVQILYEKKNSKYEETVSIFDCISVSKDNVKNTKSNSCSLIQAVCSSSHSSNLKEHSPIAVAVVESDQRFVKTATPQKISGASRKNVLVCNSNVNKASKALKDNSVATDDIPSSIEDNSNSKKEVITIDAGQLKFLKAVCSSSHSSNLKEHTPIAVVESDQRFVKTATPQKISGASRKNVLVCNSNVNKASKALKDNSVATDCIPSSIEDNSNSKKEVITIDAGQLKFLKAVCSSSHSSNLKEHSPIAVAVVESDQRFVKTATPQKISGASRKNVLVCNSNVNKASKAPKDNSVATDDIPSSIEDNSNSKKEVITIDAGQLKFLNDNFNLDKDMKFEMQIEVTVGDKKCKIASEDIKIIPVITPEASESAILSPTDCMKTNIVDENISSEPLLFIKPDLSSKENKKDAQVNEMNSIENILSESITQRSKESLKGSEINLNTSLFQALDLHDISLFNESIVQSNESIIPLNLCSKDHAVHKLDSAVPRDDSKENFPEVCLPRNQYCSKRNSCPSQGKASPRNKNNENKTPKSLKNASSSRENSAKRTPGTKIPVMQKIHKIDNFALPVSSAHEVKPIPVSAEKEKRCLHSPSSTDSAKKTASSSKKHHFCKVRNTIFSKVPQIVPSKKFVNVQSPVAKYIRNEGGTPAKTLILDPVLRDCMNDPHFHQQLESPYQPHTLPKAGASKFMKRK